MQSCIANNPSLLRNLKELRDEGLITEDEFSVEKAKLLSSTPVDCSPGFSTPGLDAFEERLTRTLTSVLANVAMPTTPATPTSSGSASTKRDRPEVPGLFRPANQPSLFDMGVRALQPSTGKKRKVVPVGLVHKCPQCDFFTTLRGPLTNHMKAKHGLVTKGSSQSVLTLFLNAMTPEQKERQTKRLRDRARDVDIAFVVSDLLASAISIATANLAADRRSNEWISAALKEDGRKNNKGSSKRRIRSLGFKAKIIQDHEMYCKTLPELRHSVSQLVADLYDIGKDQVNAWLRKKDETMALVKGNKSRNRNLCRMKMKKGLFAAQEVVVMEQFTLMRSQGRQIGPKFLRSLMKREVKKIIVDPSASSQRKAAAQGFRGGSQWLFRFAKRHQITLRRKTNNKKIPICERANKIKRWMAVFRLWLRSFHDKHGYCETESIFPAEHRWSLDQVPAGLYDPRSTYEKKGADRVHIASNGAADSHRFCTLQVFLRNRMDPSLPRHGQPRLCLCFRGTGARISAQEQEQYHPDVVVMWQRKAWYDSATCNKWVVQYAITEMKRDELGRGERAARLVSSRLVDMPLVAGERHLILCDNLAGQTKRSNPTFGKLLDEHCKATVFNLLAGDDVAALPCRCRYGCRCRYDCRCRC